MNLQILKHNNQRVLTTAQLAESYGTDNKHINDNFQNNRHRYKEGKHFFELKGEELKVFKASTEISGNLKFAPILYLWTEKGAWLHAKSLNTDEAWDAYEKLVDEYYRIVEQPKVLSSQKDSFEMQLIGVQYASAILRVDETSKIRMLEAAHKSHGVPTNHLPAYVDDEVTKPISDLLEQFEVGLSAIKMNKLLLEKGFLEEKERRSSKGQTKKFKSLTKKGLRYGKNIISPRSPKETQPHYYHSKFNELMQQIGIINETA